MKKITLQTAVLLAFGILSEQAMATGLVALPATGFAVTGGTSAYTLCNPAANSGYYGGGYIPTSGADNLCAVFPSGPTVSPVSGYSLIASSTSNLTINDAVHTNNTTIAVGTVTDRVWRNSAGNSCIYVMFAQLINVDYDLNTPGVQTFALNDFARAGFAALDASNAINAGYYFTALSDSVAFRIGRSFTSVQHRANPSNLSTVAAGYVALPLTASAPTPPGIAGGTINGLTTAWNSAMGTPTAAQQAAALSTNWVDFTTHVQYVGGNDSSVTTPLFYVQASCTSATPAKLSGALRFRQTGQDTGDLIELKVDGYAPAGGTTAY